MKRFLFLLVFMSVASVAHAQGVVQLSTYYPSPFGKYDRIQLVPRTALTAPPCDPGTMYINSNAGNQLEVCNAAGNAWAPLSAGPWTQLGSDVYVTNTNADVGIGTITPVDRLTITASWNPSDLVSLEDNTTTPRLVFGVSGTGAGNYGFITHTRGQEAAPDVVISAAGNVGIGTTTPSEILTIVGANRDVEHYSYDSSSPTAKADYDFLRARGTAAAPQPVQNGDTMGTVSFRGMDTNNVFQPETSRSAMIAAVVDGVPGPNIMPSRIDFFTSGTGAGTLDQFRMTIKSSGNVGIGTATPGEELHLGQTVGDINLRLESSLPQKWDVGLSVGNFYPAGSFGIRNVTADNVPFLIDTTGKIGIGTKTPQAKFHIDVNNDTNGGNNLGDDFIVGAEGGVGIGTTPLVGGGAGALYIKEGSSERLAKIVLQRSSTAKYLGIDFRRETGATEWSLMPSIESGGSPGNFEIWEGGGSFRRFVIKNTTGNIGIGTADPGTNKLEVAGGPIKATGGLIIETRTIDPAPLVTGQMWLCTDPGPPYCDGS